MNKKTKIFGFDYVKIIASSVIVFHHYQQVLECQFSLVNFYGGSINYGYLVELFFMISGYLMVYSEHNRNNKTKSNIKRFFHKFFRLYPMAFLSILVCLGICTGISVCTGNGQLTELWNLKTLVANFGLIFAGYPFFEMIGINNPLWYICILIQCYILYYFIELLVRHIKIKQFVLWGMIFVASLILYYFKILNEFSFRGVVSFSLGILIFYFVEILGKISFFNSKTKLLGIIIIVFAIFSCVLIFMGINQRWVLQFVTYPLFILGVVWLNIPGNELVSKLGDISFEVYIWHYPLLALLQLIAAILEIELYHSYLTMTIFLLATWGIAFLIWKYMDLPIRKVVRRILKENEKK